MYVTPALGGDLLASSLVQNMATPGILSDENPPHNMATDQQNPFQGMTPDHTFQRIWEMEAQISFLKGMILGTSAPQGTSALETGRIINVDPSGIEGKT